jgi:glycosyltransferase involved in cell wall biosynthesis
MSAALRVLGVDPERGFAGGETQVMALTIGLLRRGHRAELLCDPEGLLWRRARAAGIGCHPLRIRNSIDIAAGLRMRAMLAAERYDVAHFHTARAHAMAPYARGRVGALVVTRRMDYAPNRLFGPWLYNRAVDGVAAISSAVIEALRRSGVAPAHIAMIPSGVDCERFAPPDAVSRRDARVALGLAENEIAVAAVGALVARKGYQFLIEAIARASEELTASCASALRCLIAGAGPLRDTLARRLEESGLDGAVRLLGSLEDPRALLAAADIFAMPSLNEGLGVAAIEAMACGLPVIGAAVGGLRDAVEDDRTGMLVAPGDARGLAQAIVTLARAPEMRRAMGAAARERAVERFGIDAMVCRTLALYRACLEKRSLGEGE